MNGRRGEWYPERLNGVLAARTNNFRRNSMSARAPSHITGSATKNFDDFAKKFGCFERLVFI
jgi:hypothetical protein